MGGNIAEIMDEASVMANSGNTAEAIDMYMTAISLDPENATAWYCLGVLHSRIDSHMEAVDSFENSDNFYPNHGPTLANLAVLLENDDPAKASEYASAAIITYPEDEKLSMIANYSPPEDEPPKIFVQATAIAAEDDVPEPEEDGISPESRISKAESLTITGDHSRAVEIWKGLLEEAPNSSEIWRGLGEALFAAGYPDRAEQCRKRAKGIEDTSSVVADSEPIEEMDPADALMLAVEEAKLNTVDVDTRSDLDDAVGWYNMGINLLNEGKHDEALSSFEKAIGGCPTEEIELKVKSQNARGNALYNAGRYPESVMAYHTAIGMDPNSVTGRTLFNMGSSYAAVELFDDAIKCFTQALERGMGKEEAELCEKQVSRCRLLAREQSKRQSRAMR
tara:strand:+ start:21671 stop:22849 length:1179 start_codon:yes stop_codon:yes gene_type:complete